MSNLKNGSICLKKVEGTIFLVADFDTMLKGKGVVLTQWEDIIELPVVPRGSTQTNCIAITLQISYVPSRTFGDVN